MITVHTGKHDLVSAGFGQADRPQEARADGALAEVETIGGQRARTSDFAFEQANDAAEIGVRGDDQLRQIGRADFLADLDDRSLTKRSEALSK